MTSRTEEPTPRRLREARRRGQVAASRELTAAAALAGGLLALAATAPWVGAALLAQLREGLARAVLAPTAPGPALTGAAAAVMRLVLAPCLGALVAGALAGAAQSGFLFSPGALRPRLSRLSPAAGLRRLVTPAQLAGVALGLLKAALLLAVAWRWARAEAPGVLALARLEPDAAWRWLPALAGLLARLAAALVALGLLDLLLARRRHRRGLRMTRDEVRREHREDEGDPALRAERRRLGRALVEAGPVARATVLVVNPTRLAVALRHRRGGDEAPRVVAKGAGRDAARLRSAARRAGVPIVENVPLARALHRLVELGDEIPEELYEGAAAVLAHLYGREASP
ncbi:MAG: EscU/YscU/HrcU family type III secretion system export apparatus switch protein [Anaeromyxobacter sp.]